MSSDNCYILMFLKATYEMEREEDAFLQFLRDRGIQEEIIKKLKNDKVGYSSPKCWKLYTIKNVLQWLTVIP